LFSKLAVDGDGVTFVRDLNQAFPDIPEQNKIDLEDSQSISLYLAASLGSSAGRQTDHRVYVTLSIAVTPHKQLPI
jgi:hypothetical protein